MHFGPLVDAKTLAARLDDPDLVVFDCRFELADPAAGAAQYAAGHLPGAAHLDLERDLSGAPGRGRGRHPLPQPQALAERLGHAGVGPEHQVVCYDGGELAFAARAWWLLRWLGYARVAVLDGGFRLWCAEGRPVNTEAPPRRAPVAVSAHVQDGAMADATAVAAGLGGALCLLDARSPERYRGEREPLDPVAGHIPGARHRPAVDNLDAGGRLKAAAVLAAELRDVTGDCPASRVVCYCGSGVSACVNLLALEVAGLPGARLYPGSWSEWCADSARPLARGAEGAASTRTGRHG